MSRNHLSPVVVAAAVAALLTSSLSAETIERSAACPTAWVCAVTPLDAVEVVAVPPVDLKQVEFDDEQREADGLPPRFAVPWETELTPAAGGTWETLDNKTQLWRLRIVAPGALSLNLGFTRFFMPHNGKLFVYAADRTDVVGPFGERDNEDHGELWTPVVLADDIVVEVTLPTAAVGGLQLELGAINYGYRGFGERRGGDGERSGWCNIDVICPEGDDWRTEIRSVGLYSVQGFFTCTGSLVNNTARDQIPYFLTADHCDVTSGNASSVVVYWNYESPTCGQQGGGSLGQHQSGAYWRAGYSSSDFTLLELDDAPNPAHHVTYVGWDRSGEDATSAVTIHHPSTDEKSISFEYDQTEITSYGEYTVPGDGTHIRIVDWDLGTTEGGSSGAPLFDQNHHVIGQLHGGNAACGNDESDWYGRFARSWTGGGSSSSRLSDWLDPGGIGVTYLDTLDPDTAGITVSPITGLESFGDPGGPFTPASEVYTIGNISTIGINYSVAKTADWLSIANASGYIPAGESVDVTVSINSSADSLTVGRYTDTVNFINATDHQGDTTRPVALQVGGSSLIYAWTMDTNPAWTTEGQWAYGVPAGGGGEYGYPDPTSGYTGSKVYGYNLSGDYANNMPEHHLTTTAIDCTGLLDVVLRFYRWLGVERSEYDHAHLRISTDGVEWTTIWENSAEVVDDAWVLQEFDIADVADDQPTVYIRWTMGVTDNSWRYCGWNIDDVEIWALGEPKIKGDLDLDGDVDLDDLAILLGAYGIHDGGDIDGDGDTDLHDLADLLGNYGFGV